jgi:hypothetical protein
MPDTPTTDRELLIQHGAVLNKLCGAITELKKDNYIEHEKIFDKVDKVVISKISNRLFFWLVGLIILIQLGLVGYVGNLNTQVTKNTNDIEHVEYKLNKGG